MMSSRVTSLQMKHAEIDARLHEEMIRPAPDEAMLKELKKRKLRIKEEMELEALNA